MLHRLPVQRFLSDITGDISRRQSSSNREEWKEPSRVGEKVVERYGVAHAVRARPHTRWLSAGSDAHFGPYSRRHSENDTAVESNRLHNGSARLIIRTGDSLNRTR